MHKTVHNQRPIWVDETDHSVVWIIDQEKLPFSYETIALRSVDDVYAAIDEMKLRGAPLIGAAAAFGIYLATLEMTHLTDARDHLTNAARYLKKCRPTAVNLAWAVDHIMDSIDFSAGSRDISRMALAAALKLSDEERERCRMIGVHGIEIIETISTQKNGATVNILTHCNAGWLATTGYGTATAPIYLAHEKGIPLHVWVDETRPRNQGARLTAWELGEAGIPYTLIPDNTGGHLMQHGIVDLVIVGCDRASRRGDVANKIGTYLKALAAYDNKVPFYVALPSSSIDFSISDGIREIVVEERNPDEVSMVTGFDGKTISRVRIAPENARAANYGFDVTPARLVTALITESGVCGASEEEITDMFIKK